MTEEEKLAVREWYIQGFNAVPIMVDFAIVGGVIKMPEEIGYGYDVFISVFKEDFCDMHYSVPGLKNVYENFLERQEKDDLYLRNLIERSEAHYAEIESYIKKVGNIDSGLSFEGKVDTASRLLEYYVLTASIPHVVEGFSLCADVEIKELLAAHLAKIGLEKELPKLITSLTMPTMPSFLAAHETRIRQLADKVRADKELSEAFVDSSTEERLKGFPEFFQELTEHAREYYWINASYVKAPKNDVDTVISQIKRILDEKNTAEGEDTILKERKEALIHELGISGRLLFLINLSDTITSWHDDRKKMILKVATILDSYLGDIAEDLNMPHGLLRYLTQEEFTLEHLKSLKQETLEERRDGFIVVQTKDGQKHFTGKEYERFNALLSKSDSREKVKEIPGQCSSIGRVIGRVSICKSLEAIDNFEEGNILVTSMTRPEYLPAMKKAAAIVTDEGGVTCHAAIISRELNKPCITGTRNATSILRDGDLVDVKANHGMVVIIEKVHN